MNATPIVGVLNNEILDGECLYDDDDLVITNVVHKAAAIITFIVDVVELAVNTIDGAVDDETDIVDALNILSAKSCIKLVRYSKEQISPALT
ncbi:hypothetical protein NDU88_000730 [Pleurodeles waltl]|uniref:Uncharacterized protein n=1 Tax=Pleurodeles waltl TaxID=8319 RepID=A0AAV7SX92_PLEWA|nr:hypothetical protein NDU88_000730 [Pleurodeles waltl]